MGKTITICFTNNKGGSGKTTTCSNLGAAMAQAGKKVLLIDGDMQLNLSLAFFPEHWVLEQAKGEKNLYCAIGKQEELSGYVVHTPYENLDLIPSSTLMSSIEYELFTKWQREFILRKCIQKIKDAGNYDYILIDAPPTLGGWVMNILCASDRVIIPVEASPWGMFGLANMFEFLNEVKQITPELEVAGIAVTKVDTRKSYYKQTMETLHELEDIHVFEQIIRVDSSVEWSQDNSIPVVEYKKIKQKCQGIYEIGRGGHGIMSVGRESIRRAANAGAGKTVKKPVVSTKEAEKPETISVTEEKKKTAKGSVHINEELPVYLL